MFDRLREEIVQYLARHAIGVLSMRGGDAAYALPVRYHSQGLQITCLLPRWSDAAYYVEQPVAVVLVVPDAEDGACWLHYTGEAVAVVEGDIGSVLQGEPAVFQPERYRMAKLTPSRIDLIDQRQGWGWRQTLECR